MCRIIVEFNADPELPLDEQHKGTPIRCKVRREKEFKNFDEAREFIIECTNPITTLDELNNKEWEYEFKRLVRNVRKLEKMFQETGN